MHRAIKAEHHAKLRQAEPQVRMQKSKQLCRLRQKPRAGGLETIKFTFTKMIENATLRSHRLRTVGLCSHRRRTVVFCGLATPPTKLPLQQIPNSRASHLPITSYQSLTNDLVLHV